MILKLTMFYIPRTQHHHHQPEYQPYHYPPHPYLPTFLCDNDYEHEHDDYSKSKHREYLDRSRPSSSMNTTLENQRHRAQLAALAERGAFRKRSSLEYGYEQAQASTPLRRRKPTPRSHPQSHRRLDDLQARLLEELYGIPAESIIQQLERVSVSRHCLLNAIDSLVSS